MPDKPSPEEIAFAQKRKKLQDALAPYFQRKAESAAQRPVEMGAKILTEGNTRPLEHTIKGQTFAAHARFEDGTEITLLIGHTPEWEPVVRIHNNQGGVEPTVFVRGGLDASIVEIQGLIDRAFNRIKPG